MTPRRRVAIVIAAHCAVTALVAGAFAWRFGQSPRVVLPHLLLVAEWDLLLVAMAAVVRWRTATIFRILLIATCTVQAYLYVLDAVSNVGWGRNITGHLVTAFAPTIWSGLEPFPVGRPGIVLFLGGTFALVATIVWCSSRALRTRPTAGLAQSRYLAAGVGLCLAAAFAGTLKWGIAERDNRLWKDELVASFFRPVGYAFEPTARRHSVAERDAVLQASYPRRIAGARRTNVILIIVDSLRADHMQAYGYERETTPFLSQLVASGQMKKVDRAFSTCSESFCGITSTLAGREFRDISARTFQLQDVLSDEGYQTWFLLSGNHTAWNGLTQFYHAADGTLFDGSQTQRYTMDDDRLVLEGLERVPPASPQHPAFFYVHLMSTHYLGVQFAESHVFTRPDDTVDPGEEPYAILQQLQKRDRYDDKVRQADGVIHQLFDALSAKHYLDDAIVVVTGDHGEGLGERHWAHGWHLYNEDIRIPMLFYDLRGTKFRDLSFATQVDIAPTILDRLGLPIPESWEGSSLLAAPRVRFTYHQTYFLPNRFAVLYREGPALYKFIATPDYGTEELYDLIGDGGETHNLIGEQPQLAAMLREKVRAYRE
ncbi:MAG TPA: sulfatase [Vicinamibacterales bacterium]|jgi:glucan phosphoethanolaminetransferase (alkaline phosphatase superfamily)|nr:sulfatase [Vicinamibacterales bacterium]